MGERLPFKMFKIDILRSNPVQKSYSFLKFKRCVTTFLQKLLSLGQGWIAAPQPVILFHCSPSSKFFLALTTFSSPQALLFADARIISCFLAFWLPHVLRATTACTFLNISTSKSPAAMACNFYLSSPQMASHRAPLASLLFDLPRTTKHWKHTVLRDFSTFSRTCIFSLLTLPTPAIPSVHIVGSLTSKLRSNITKHQHA